MIFTVKWFLWLVKWKECQGKFAIVKDQLFFAYLAIRINISIHIAVRFCSSTEKCSCFCIDVLPLMNFTLKRCITIHCNDFHGVFMCVWLILIYFIFSVAMHFYLQMRKAVNWFFFTAEAPINESLTYSLTQRGLFMKMLQQQ